MMVSCGEPFGDFLMLTRGKEVEEDFFEWPVGGAEVVFDVVTVSGGLNRVAMSLEPLEVGLAGDLRVDEALRTGFGIAEVGGFLKGEVDLGAIHEVEEHKVVPHGPEEGELLLQMLDWREEIGDEADHAALAQQIG